MLAKDAPAAAAIRWPSPVLCGGLHLASISASTYSATIVGVPLEPAAGEDDAAGGAQRPAVDHDPGDRAVAARAAREQGRYPGLADEADAMGETVGEQRADQGGAAADDPARGPVAELVPREVLPRPPLLELAHRVRQLVGVEAERVPQGAEFVAVEQPRLERPGPRHRPVELLPVVGEVGGDVELEPAAAGELQHLRAGLDQPREQLRRGLPGGRLLQVAQRERRVVDPSGLAHVRVARNPDGAGRDRGRPAEEPRLLQYGHAEPGVGGDGRRHETAGPGADDDHVVRLRQLRILRFHPISIEFTRLLSNGPLLRLVGQLSAPARVSFQPRVCRSRPVTRSSSSSEQTAAT